MYDSHLEQTYYEVRTQNRRRAAEIAYVLAVLYSKDGNEGEAVRYAYESLGLFSELQVQTLEDAAPVYDELNGVRLPNLIHEGVVRKKLAHLFSD